MSMPIQPRIIIHGGAGNITPANLPPERRGAYRDGLLAALQRGAEVLHHNVHSLSANPGDGGTALDAVVAAVAEMEDNPLFNCARGAVFTRAGTNELEASVMVSTGSKKRAAAVSLLRTVKNPIYLAREILVRGESDMEPDELSSDATVSAKHNVSDTSRSSTRSSSSTHSVGAQGHCHLSGPQAETLAKDWGLEIVAPKYFWTKKRWQEHRRGLDRGALWKASTSNAKNVHGDIVDSESMSGDDQCDESCPDDDPDQEDWDGCEYLAQGTVGAVALDAYGTLAVATSTGGLTNKLPGRIGDTPTIGAGFWAEQWTDESESSSPATPWPEAPWQRMSRSALPWSTMSRFALPWTDALARDAWALGTSVMSCFSDVFQPNYSLNVCGSKESEDISRSWSGKSKSSRTASQVHAVALSGTGNGDSFLRVAAMRTVGALVRFSGITLAKGMAAIVGPGGALQDSAGDRWGRPGSGEGEGGAIGIELVHGRGRVVADLNCGGMFRAWLDQSGQPHVRIFRDTD